MSRPSQSGNCFGINRNSSLKWITSDWKNLTNNLRIEFFQEYDCCFFDGNLGDFTLIHNAISTFQPSTSSTSFVAALPGSYRLRQLARFENMTWTLIHHERVGGCTTTKV